MLETLIEKADAKLHFQAESQSKTRAATLLEFGSNQEFATYLTANTAHRAGDTEGSLIWQGSPEWFDEIVIYCQEPQDQAAVEGLIGYYLSGPLALGDEYWFSKLTRLELPKATTESGHWLRVAVDLTKSRRDDVVTAMEEFDLFLSQGSPVRKTDRAGQGTAGTRKCQPIIGQFWVAYR